LIAAVGRDDHLLGIDAGSWAVILDALSTDRVFWALIIDASCPDHQFRHEGGLDLRLAVPAFVNHGLPHPQTWS